jgi:hypothetical protein
MQAQPKSLFGEYYSLEQLASELDVCTETLKRWERLRVGPPVTRVARKRLYAKSSVVAWLRSREQKRTVA